jgi:hypothetical protein
MSQRDDFTQLFCKSSCGKPRQSLNNNTAGVRERSEWSGGPKDIEGKTTGVGASECGQRTSFNRTREAGNRDEVEGIVADTLDLFQNGACRVSLFTLVGFIVWLDRFGYNSGTK